MPDLPPPGDARRDELKRRTDTLDEQAETSSAAGEHYAADPKAFRVESELAQHFNELDVSHQDPAFAYCWVNSGHFGRFIKMKSAQGWEVVQGDMSEAIELKGIAADTTRRLGDVILMRLRKDRKLLFDRQERAHRRAVESGVTSTLEEMGEKYRGKGVIVHTDMPAANPRLLDTMQKRAQARSIARQTTDQLLREGRMPGVPAPGSEGG